MSLQGWIVPCVLLVQRVTSKKFSWLKFKEFVSSGLIKESIALFLDSQLSFVSLKNSFSKILVCAP